MNKGRVFSGLLLLVSILLALVPIRAEEIWECSKEGSKRWTVTTTPVRSRSKRCRKRDFSASAFQQIPARNFASYKRAALAELEQSRDETRNSAKARPTFLWQQKELTPGPLPETAPQKTYCMLSGEIRTPNSIWVEITFLRDDKTAARLPLLTQAAELPLYWTHTLGGSCRGVSVLYSGAIEQKQ